MEDMVSPQARYEKLIESRGDYEKRAEELSKLTIPYLFPTDGSTSSTLTTDSYAGRYSAIAINGLTSKMVMSLLPPAGSSFKLEPDADTMLQFTAGDDAAKQEIIRLLNNEQLKINKEIEAQQIRPQFYEFMQALIAVSPVIVEKVKGSGIKWHSLRTFGVKLDDRGEAIEMAIKEKIPKVLLPDIVVEGEDEDVDMYTLCTQTEPDKWTVVQYVGEQMIGSESTYKGLDMPYVYLGWTRQKGDTYHRPYSDQYMGILKDFENINKVLVEGSIIASKALIMVNPLGVTKKGDLSKSVNGDVIDGSDADVSAFQLGKNYDFQIAMQKEAELRQQIDIAYLSPSAARRDAERVTATEVQRDAMDLENSLAGIYSVMSKKFSKWIVVQVMKEIGIKFDTIEVSVVTGLDSLGRNSEAGKLDQFVGRLANLQMMNYIKPEALINKYASLEGIDAMDLIKSAADIQQDKEQAMQDQARMQQAQAGGAAAGQIEGQQAAMQ